MCFSYLFALCLTIEAVFLVVLCVVLIIKAVATEVHILIRRIAIAHDLKASITRAHKHESPLADSLQSTYKHPIKK